MVALVGCERVFVTLSDQAAVVDRLADALTVSDGRRAGDPETRIHLDELVPFSGVGSGQPARWRLSTTELRLYPAPAEREVMRVWHSARPGKGRRLVAVDLAEGSRVAALLSWHFEPSGAGGGQRPHLVTSAAVRSGIASAQRSVYLVGLQLLACAMLAIDQRTIDRGEVGLVLDNAIDLDAAELAALGFLRGRARRGYTGAYWLLRR